MKHSIFAFLVLTPLLALSAHAESVTYVGTTTGSTMPGSASDFIFFDQADYPFKGPVQGNGTSPYVSLTDFTINGGLQGGNGYSGDAVITTPAGTPLTTGAIAATGQTAAFALTPTPSGSTFNYNDFNVYLMISNTDGNLNDLTVSLDPRVSGSVDIGGNSVVVTDNTTAGTNSAEYLEFNVSGFATDLENGTGDLVVSATANSGNTYIGAVSFASVPEPSTYALLGLGLVSLLELKRWRTIGA